MVISLSNSVIQREKAINDDIIEEWLHVGAKKVNYPVYSLKSHLPQNVDLAKC